MAEPLIPIPHRQAIYFAIFLVLYEFLTYIANDMIMPAMLQVVHSFHASESLVASSLTVYILGGASLQFILGPLSDAYGRRPMMLIGALMFFLFTLLIAQAQSIDQFLIARFFQGTGLCFIGVIGYATIQELFDEMEAIRLIAIMANAAILAPLLGPLVGAVILNYASWRSIFISIAIGALLALWGLWKFMPEPIGATKRDGRKIPRTSFSIKTIIKNYAQLLTNYSFICSAIALGLIGVNCVTWIALAPIIMIKQAHLSVLEYGLWQLPIFSATILGNGFLHRLTYKYSIKTIISFGCIILTIGTAFMAILPYLKGNNYYLLLPGTIIYFFALSIINAPLNRFCLYTTAVSKGTASALISLSVMIVGAGGIEVANLFYQHHSNFYLGLYANGVTLIFLLFTALGFWFDHRQKCKREIAI